MKVPLSLLHEWWGAQQDAQREKIIANVEAQVAWLPVAQREALLGEVRRLIEHRFQIQHGQIDQVIAFEIETQLEGRTCSTLPK